MPGIWNIVKITTSHNLLRSSAGPPVYFNRGFELGGSADCPDVRWQDREPEGGLQWSARHEYRRWAQWAALLRKIDNSWHGLSIGNSCQSTICARGAARKHDSRVVPWQPTNRSSALPAEVNCYSLLSTTGLHHCLCCSQLEGSLLIDLGALSVSAELNDCMVCLPRLGQMYDHFS